MLRREMLAALLLAGVAAAFGIGIGKAEPVMKIEPVLKTVRHDGVALATEARGEPENGTILLVMGATASMLWWPDELLDRLAAAGYRAIRFDHRDTGGSTTNAPGDVRYDVVDLAGDLMAILDAYEVESAHLVGMSLGGYVSQIAALENPKRVRSLTLISAEPVGLAYAGEGVSPEILAHFGKLATLDWSDREAVIGLLLKIAELSTGPAMPFESALARQRIENALARTQSMASAFNHSMMVGDVDPSWSAKALTLPTLLIHGSNDPVISAAAARVAAEAIAGAELRILEGRGHELHTVDIPGIAASILDLCARAS